MKKLFVTAIVLCGFVVAVPFETEARVHKSAKHKVHKAKKTRKTSNRKLKKKRVAVVIPAPASVLMNQV